MECKDKDACSSIGHQCLHVTLLNGLMANDAGLECKNKDSFCFVSHTMQAPESQTGIGAPDMECKDKDVCYSSIYAPLQTAIDCAHEIMSLVLNTILYQF